MTPVHLRAQLARFLGRLSRLTYLAVYAAIALRDIDADVIARQLPGALKQLSGEAPDESGRYFEESDVNMQPEQIDGLRTELPSFVVDMLIVELEAFVHGFLGDASGQQINEDAKPIETLIAGLWPREARYEAQKKKSGKGAPGEHWSYKDIILLSEVRHSIVHGDGKVSLERSQQRLRVAGWTEEELAPRTALEKRDFKDLLRFKRAVRTLANEVIAFAERPPLV